MPQPGTSQPQNQNTPDEPQPIVSHEMTEILNAIPIGVSLIDPQGTLLYYNPAAARLVDRRPELLGADVRGCHQTQRAVDIIDQLLDEFRQGRTEPYVYQAQRKGRQVEVTITPQFSDGRLTMCLHTICPVFT